MLAVPATFWPYLRTDALRPVVAYELDPIDTDAVSKIVDGGMEVWSSATDLTNWTETVSAGNTVNRESAIVYAGSFSARLDRTAAGSLNIQRTGITLTPGKWYSLSVRFRASAGGLTNAVSLYLLNFTQGKALQSDGTFGSSSAPLYATITPSTSWGRSVLWFQVPTSYGATNTYRWQLRSTDGSPNGSVYLDEAEFKGPFDRPALYFGPQALTWDGKTYTALAVEQSPIEEQMGLTVPTVKVAFDNVVNILRPYFTPDDLLTGSRLTARLLMRDSSNAFLAESLVLYSGLVRRPDEVTENRFSCEARGPIDGSGRLLPRRRADIPCQNIFADLIDCNYVSTTTASGAGTSSTALTVADGSRLVAGRSIKIGTAGTSVVMAAVAGTAVTLAAARSWANADPVIYTDCARDFADCQNRQREHEYTGFRGVKHVRRGVRVSADRKRQTRRPQR